MKKKEAIHSWQMVIIFISFQIGSAIMYVPGPLIGIAKNTSWLSVIIAGSLSFLILVVVLKLHQKYPQMSFIEMSRQLIGNKLTILLAIPYTITILFMLCLILIDIKSFFTSSMMTQTPDYIFYSIILLNVVLTARAGIEVMARMFTFFLFIMYGSSILIMLLAFPFYQPENLLPVLPDGLKPIIHGTYLLVFPFGEIVLLNMLLPFAKKSHRPKLHRRLYWTHVLNTFTLLIVVIVTIMVLGPMAERRAYSLFQIARLIEIGDFMERLESIIGISITFGTFTKATIVMFILNLVLSELFKLNNQQVLSFPLALVVFLLSSTMFQYEAEQVKTVHDTWPFLVMVVGIFPTLLLGLIALFRKNTPSSSRKK